MQDTLFDLDVLAGGPPKARAVCLSRAGKEASDRIARWLRAKLPPAEAPFIVGDTQVLLWVPVAGLDQRPLWHGVGIANGRCQVVRSVRFDARGPVSLASDFAPRGANLREVLDTLHERSDATRAELHALFLSEGFVTLPTSPVDLVSNAAAAMVLAGRRAQVREAIRATSPFACALRLFSTLIEVDGCNWTVMIDSDGDVVASHGDTSHFLGFYTILSHHSERELRADLTHSLEVSISNSARRAVSVSDAPAAPIPQGRSRRKAKIPSLAERTDEARHVCDSAMARFRAVQRILPSIADAGIARLLSLLQVQAAASSQQAFDEAASDLRNCQEELLARFSNPFAGFTKSPSVETLGEMLLATVAASSGVPIQGIWGLDELLAGAPTVLEVADGVFCAMDEHTHGAVSSSGFHSTCSLDENHPGGAKAVLQKFYEGWCGEAPAYQRRVAEEQARVRSLPEDIRLVLEPSLEWCGDGFYGNLVWAAEDLHKARMALVAVRDVAECLRCGRVASGEDLQLVLAALADYPKSMAVGRTRLVAAYRTLVEGWLPEGGRLGLTGDPEGDENTLVVSLATPVAEVANRCASIRDLVGVGVSVKEAILQSGPSPRAEDFSEDCLDFSEDEEGEEDLGEE